jgi:hypothetical protein
MLDLNACVFFEYSDSVPERLAGKTRIWNILKRSKVLKDIAGRDFAFVSFCIHFLSFLIISSLIPRPEANELSWSSWVQLVALGSKQRPRRRGDRGCDPMWSLRGPSDPSGGYENGWTMLNHKGCSKSLVFFSLVDLNFVLHHFCPLATCSEPSKFAVHCSATWLDTFAGSWAWSDRRNELAPHRENWRHIIQHSDFHRLSP